jgi:hypothetical protein
VSFSIFTCSGTVFNIGFNVGWEKATDEPTFNGFGEKQQTDGSQRILTVSQIGYGVSILWTSFDLSYLYMFFTHVSQYLRNFYKQNKDHVEKKLSKNNQVKSFSFSLSVAFHPTISNDEFVI